MTRAVGFIVLGAAAMIFSWLLVGVVEQFTPLQRRARAVLFAYILACIVAMSVPFLSNLGSYPDRTSVPCGHGADFDTRDGLCYTSGSVPAEFQRH
jgi:hypothetical protein